MSVTRSLRLALIGCGDVAQRDYLPELHRLDDRVELVAVCGRTEARARKTGEEHGAAWFTDYRKMLATVDIDLVANLTPIQVHAETTLAALEAGKHVYSEKPLAGTVAEAEAVKRAAVDRGLIVVAAPSIMLYPQIRRARKLLREGTVGPVSSVRGYGHGGVPPWGGYTSDSSPFFAKGGGPVRDMGVYPLHTITGLLGPAERVTAMASKTISSFEEPSSGRVIPMEVEDNWDLLLDLGENRLASVSANFCVAGSRAPQLEIYGHDGTIALDLLDVSAPIEVLNRTGKWEQVPIDGGGRASGPDHLLGIEHLVDCVTSKREPEVSMDHAIHVIEIMEKAALSVHDGRTQTIESRFAFTGKD